METLAVKRNEPVMANLNELSSVLKALNEESDQANKILAEFESKINAMNPGVEAWITDGSYSPIFDLLKDERKWTDEQGWVFSEEVHLGFGKYGEKYQLLFNSITFRKDPTIDDDPEYFSESNPRPLLQAPRDYRLRAMGLLEKLVDVIVLQANRRRAAFSAGKKVVENLNGMSGSSQAGPGLINSPN